MPVDLQVSGEQSCDRVLAAGRGGSSPEVATRIPPFPAPFLPDAHLLAENDVDL
jgi:hypothetical protein